MAAPPSNDHFAGVTISGPDGTVPGTNTGATGQPGEPNIAGRAADMSVWYSWVAPESGPTSFNLRDANFDTLLGVFTGNSLSSLVSVASNDDFNGTTRSRVTFHATANTWYRIAVDGYGADHGAFGLQWAQNSPANDNFASPRVLSGPTGVGHTESPRSTGEPGEPSHWGIPDRTVWYSWTAPESGTATFTTPWSDFDTAIAAYTGTSITGLTQRASNDDTDGSLQSKITFAVTSGTVYRIAVDGTGAATGSVRLQWTVNAPANDDFASPLVVTGTYGSQVGTSVRSTGEPGEPGTHAGAFADNSVWYSWTPTQTGPAVVRLRDLFGGLDPAIEVYTGASLGALTSVGEGAGEATFDAVANTEYRIAVDGHFPASTGSFTLEYILGTCAGLDATIFANGGTTNGTPGNDVIVGSTLADTVNAGAGNDTICTLSGNDTIRGEAGIDRQFGGDGNDIMQEDAAPNGRDRLSGDGGADTVLYNLRTTAINADLTNNTNDDGAAGELDLITTAEVIQGGSANDTMRGNAAREVLRGNAGNDQLIGGAGNDVLHGGAGNDALFGEAGMDTLALLDNVNANDTGNGGADSDTSTQDPGDTVVNVP